MKIGARGLRSVMEGVMTDIEKYHVQPTYCMQNIREVLNTLQKGEEK